MIESLEELWPRALADAGFSPEELVLLALEGTPEERGAPGGSWARMQPGGVPAASEDWPFTEEELAPARERPDLPKVAVYTGVDPAALLALLRHSLQTVRQATATRTAYAFAVDASDALHRVYRESGPGGAVVYNAQPMMRDASAHAAALGTRVFGPQLGRLRDPEFGPLFRTDNEPEALEILQQKENVRLLEDAERRRPDVTEQDMKRVRGGLLVQDRDIGPDTREEMQVVTERKPTEPEWGEMLFAWRVCKHVRSNAIVLARDLATSGIGAGQMSRVDSVRLAVDKARAAGIDLEGSALASDAFFPFADGPALAMEAGATAIIQPGGSQRDPEVVEACDAAGITMVFTSRRHFRH